MPTVTVRPNATLATGVWGTNAASFHAATSDNSDGTDVIASAVGVPSSTDSFIVGFAGYTLPALGQVRSVTTRVRANVNVGASGNAPVLHTRQRVSGVDGSDQIITGISEGGLRPNPVTGVTTYTLGARTVSPSGAAWTQTDINNLALNVWATSNLSVSFAIYELYADLVYNEAPVVSGVLPTTSQATSRPTVSWTYSDPELDAQERYRIKVYSAAQYGAGGFSPDTSPATWDSTEVFSAATSAVIGTDLVNGTTYRAYVRAADVGSGGRYSNWAYAQFAISVASPPTPALTVTPDPTLARNLLHVVPGTFAPAAQRVIIEKSSDGGTTWATVRGANEVSPTGGVVDVYDYEVVRGVLMRYRARTVADVSGIRVASANTADVTATLASTGWWLKDPLAPGTNMQLEVQPGFSFHRKEPQSVFEPLGRSVSVVITDGVKGIEGTLTAWSKDAARYAKIRALVGSGHNLWLEDNLGQAWYIHFGPQTGWSLLRAAPLGSEATPIRHLHAVELPFIEVGAPSGDTVAAGTPTP